MPKQRVAKIVQADEEIVERPVLATAIRNLSRGVQKLLSQGLNERAITCLLHEFSGVGKPDIRSVLASLKNLEREYCK